MISVVIPAWNAVPTIAESLRSIAAQSRAPDEVIVVDDGSDDGTAAIASSEAVVSRVIRTPNKGTAAALNLGISEARGDLLAFLDADDLWTPDNLDLQCRAMAGRHDGTVICGHVEFFLCPSVAKEDAQGLVFEQGRQLGRLVGAMLMHRRTLDRVGAFDESLRRGFSIDWVARAQAAEVSFTMLEEVVLRRRVRPGTLSQRSLAEDDALSKDFLSVARNAIARRLARGEH